jgi:uncharacterized protein YoxC
MTTDVTRDEMTQLTTRVDVLEREVEGEKLVTRHILEQTRRNSDDLAAIKTRLDRVEGKVDGLADEVGGLASQVHSLSGLPHEVGGLKKAVDDLVRTLPKVVGEAVRAALPKRGKR